MVENSRMWHAYFLENSGDADFPWDSPSFLAAPEREAVASSLAQFQLGEGSDGSGLLRRGEIYAWLSQDGWFVPALRLFIGEEQRHSRWLGRFLDREGIPRLRDHWVDGAFRRLRKLAGLELCLTVLVTAECIAMPYYRALRDATGSRLLGALCTEILREEAAHLEYQADNLAVFSRGMPSWRRPVIHALHTVVLTVTCGVVWHQHFRVFRAAKYGWLRVWAESALELSRIDQRIAASLYGSDVKENAGPCRSSSSAARPS